VLWRDLVAGIAQPFSVRAEQAIVGVAG